MREKSEFNHIFELYYNQLLHFAMQYIVDEDDARDMVSSVFEDVWLNFADIDSNTIKPFLFIKVKNKCIDTLRRRKCHERYIEFASVMSSSYISEERYDEQEHNEHIINNILNTLQSPTKEILIACYMEEKKYKDVAKEMGISISTVKKHMVKALKMIRNMKRN